MLQDKFMQAVLVLLMQMTSEHELQYSIKVVLANQNFENVVKVEGIRVLLDFE